MKYFKLKNRNNSQGARIAGHFFNNATVIGFEGRVPSAIQMNIKSGVLEAATKKDFDARQKQLAEAEAHAKEVSEKRNAENNRRLAAKTGETVEEIEEKKAPKKKAATKKKVTPPKKTAEDQSEANTAKK